MKAASNDNDSMSLQDLAVEIERKVDATEEHFIALIRLVENARARVKREHGGSGMTVYSWARKVFLTVRPTLRAATQLTSASDPMAEFAEICLSARALRKKVHEEFESERAKLGPERTAVVAWVEAASIDDVRQVAASIRMLNDMASSRPANDSSDMGDAA